MCLVMAAEIKEESPQFNGMYLYKFPRPTERKEYVQLELTLTTPYLIEGTFKEMYESLKVGDVLKVSGSKCFTYEREILKKERQSSFIIKVQPNSRTPEADIKKVGEVPELKGYKRIQKVKEIIQPLIRRKEKPTYVAMQEMQELISCFKREC